MTNTDISAAPLAEQWQELICQLAEVYSANVIFSEDGAPVEIHVLASDAKNSKSIVRDVQSALSARFGVNIDYHIISVAQIRDSMARRGSEQRFKYIGSDIRSVNGHIEVSVTLSMRDGTYTGTSDGSASLYSRRVCLVEATLAAVTSFSGDMVFEFAGLQTAKIGAGEAMLVQIDCPSSRQTLLGSAIITADSDTAVINSTLNAINRRVSLTP